MKKSKKGLLTLVGVPLLSLLVGSLTGCGSLGGPIDTYDLDVNIETRGTTINMITGFGSAVNSALTPLLDDFTALTGINVDYETKGGYKNLQTAINLAATNLSQLPQVANGYPDHFAGYISSNIQLRLNGLIENDKNRNITEPGSYVNGNGETVTTLPRLDYEDFYSDYVLENETLEFDDEGNGYILGIPFNKSTEVMVYNKTLFDWAQSTAGKAILTSWGVGDIFVPETWADVKAVGVELRKLVLHKDSANKTVIGNYLGTDGVIYATETSFPAGVSLAFSGHDIGEADKFRPFSYDSTENLVTTLIRQYGGELTTIDATQTGKGYVNFNDADTKQITINALEMIQELWDLKVIGIASTPWEDSTGYCSNAFKAGQSVMNVGSSGGLVNLTGKFALGIAPIPYKDVEHKFVLSQGTNLALFQVPTNDSDRERKLVAAWKLIVFLSQAENATFTSQSGYFPTGEKVANSDIYQDWLNNPGGSAIDKANNDAGKVNGLIYNNDDLGWTKFVDPGFRGSSDIRDEIGLIPGYMFNEEYPTIQDILDAVYRILSDYVK
ncbi:MAG: extracellular solute-binding protein, partial [Erysipelotrichia bacterium]|jgi:ABC-type glycerol-3-phosphate transport system substrate-binding protein|nr:extracellular solute-binding protein [Bacilli bacterium]NLB49609.1 extracellular solute-binding protein [Erysipelotrichia bacterium]